MLGLALTLPAKWAGLMPAHITWLGLAIVPAALFALLGSLFAGPLWLAPPVALGCS